MKTSQRLQIKSHYCISDIKAHILYCAVCTKISRAWMLMHFTLYTHPLLLLAKSYYHSTHVYTHTDTHTDINTHIFSAVCISRSGYIKAGVFLKESCEQLLLTGLVPPHTASAKHSTRGSDTHTDRQITFNNVT